MIKNFHIHVYYDDKTIQLAKDLSEDVKDKFTIGVGTFHEKNVGPHPRWSVLFSVPTDSFGEVISYVAMNRKGLTIFAHPDTGNDLSDHTDRAIWMGEMLELDLKIFNS